MEEQTGAEDTENIISLDTGILCTGGSKYAHCKKFIGNFSKYIRTAPCVPYIIGSQYGGFESNSIRKFFRKKGNTSEYWRTEIHRIEIQLYTERSVQSGYIWKNFQYFFYSAVRK